MPTAGSRNSSRFYECVLRQGSINFVNSPLLILLLIIIVTSIFQKLFQAEIKPIIDFKPTSLTGNERAIASEGFQFRLCISYLGTVDGLRGKLSIHQLFNGDAP